MNHHAFLQGFLGYNNLLVQYYSTWLACSEGGTPEPPLLPPFMTTVTEESTDENATEAENNVTKWKPTFRESITEWYRKLQNAYL